MGKKPRKKARSVWSAAGRSVDDLIKLGSDYNRYRKLSEPTLRKIVNRLASAGNKRLRRMEAAGEQSPAYRAVQESGGKFTTRGKTLEGLRREFLRAKQFFEDKTSSLQFWRKVKDTAAYQGEKGKVIKPPAPAPAPATPPPPSGDSARAGAPVTVPEEPEDQEMPPTLPYVEVQEDGGILLEDGNVYYPDQNTIINPETGEIVGHFYGSENRNRYAEDSPEYQKIVGDMWGAVDDLIKLDPVYQDRAFRYNIFDMIEQSFMDSSQGATIEDIKKALEGRMEEIHRARMEQIGGAQRRGTSTFFEE